MKIVFSDIDGTFTTYDAGVPQLNIDAVKALQQEGNRFVFVSGRNLDQINMVKEEVSFDCDVIFSNGGGYQLKGEAPVYEYTINFESLKKVIDILERYNTFYHFHSNKQVFLKPMHYFTNEFNQVKKRLKELGDFGQQAATYKEHYFNQLCQHVENPLFYIENTPDLFITKIELMLGNPLMQTILVEEITKLGLKAYSSFPTNLEIVHPLSNKGTAIQSYLKKFPASKTYGIGDAENDIDMLKAVDVSVAVANASEHLKEMCDYATSDVADGGVGEFIFKHVINK